MFPRHRFLLFLLLVALFGVQIFLRPTRSQGVNHSVVSALAAFAVPQGSSYTYRRTITIDHTKVANTDQTNFPVLISGTYSYLATVANGGNVQNANGYDVIFASDIGCATKLDHEVETYTATTGAVNYWVKVPLLSHTSDTTIYLCYGNSSITTDQSNKTGVWDANYKGVWHLSNGATLNANDSTTNGNNGTISGAVAAAGRTDGGASLNGTSDHVQVKAGKVDTSATTGTVSAWVKISALDANGVVLGYGGAAATDPALWGVYIREVSGNYYFAMSARKTNGGAYSTVRGNTVLATGTWYYVTYSTNGSTWKIRVNGSSAETLTNVLGTNTGDWLGDISPTTPDRSDIGAVYAGGAYSSVNFWHGILDEVRLSNVERNDDWVSTEYNNQSSPATFYLISASSNCCDTSMARLDPMNQTGGADENPLSRNFNWKLPLLSLPGRAGMDLGLTLAYNSLVWTKNGSSISFDDDHGFPSPGFRLGFPVIQPLYFNSETGRNAYLLISPDGGRTELRQVGASTLYESADSSHLLLDAATMVLRSTDGTQLSYASVGSEYDCTQIKDRNGNYITINYTLAGRIDTVLDTLGRSIKFNYDGSGALTSITQVWNQGTVNQVTHNWATFTYTNTAIVTNFQGLNVYGPATIKALTSVTLADGSHSDFSYTNWGQVWKVSGYAADNHLLGYRSYKLPGSPLFPAPPPQGDCPRFSERHDWAQYWNGDTDDTAASNEEAVTTFADPVPESWTMPDGSPQSGTRAQVTQPDGTSNKIYFIGTPGSASGWQRSLPALVNTYDSAGVLQRQAMTTWTQDNTAVSYQLNPRVTETNIYDPAGNRARTQTTYQQFTFTNGTSCQLPIDFYEYAADATTKLRSTRTEYHTSTSYTDRRILGLVTERRLYEGDVNNGGVLMSKVGFFYDNENGASSIQGTDAPVQHDNTNYSASFVTGRGNLSSVKRYDVTNTAQFTVTSMKYNTTGAVVSSKDALNHEVTASYADAFSDGNNTRNTLAYPTMVTDADGYSSTTRYHFDFGAITYARTPQPSVTTNTPGPEQTFAFDIIGRLQQQTNLVNGAYKRFEYPTSMNRIDTYTTIQEGLGEEHSFQIRDGGGRVVATATDHPGSYGGFSGQKMVYDLMGRVVYTSNPTETSASGTPSQWTTAGDDAAAGWIYTQQTYDWKGRPLTITNQDGTTKSASYAGCGCAGGEVVTLTDEGTINAGVAKKRQQRIYKDVLGRVLKTETLNWQGGSVYSTTVNTYNARDQIIQVREYAGAEGSPTYQDTTLTYDGYGRLKTKHVPEQSVGASTTWDYNSDDTLQKITDGRGATTTFSYSGNNRKLVSSVTHTLSGNSTLNASFTYDAVGNRTSMIDALGSVEYQYDQLSRLKAEIRTITGVTNPNAGDGRFKLSYDYNLAGALKKITDATNMSIVYSYDSIGRINSVTGADTLYANVSQYASSFSYRAWGALKDFTDGTNQIISRHYNARLQTSQFSIGAMVQNFDYFNDGRIKFLHNLQDGNFDRSFSYDHDGRLTAATSGGAARQDGGAVPYNQTFGYDAFSNLTARNTSTWNQFSDSDSAVYINNRRNGWDYDSDGRNIAIEERNYYFDAAGQTSRMEAPMWISALGSSITKIMDSSYDGDGQKVKEVIWDSYNYDPAVTRYYLRSSVLKGAIIAEIDGAGQKQVGYVYAGDRVLAKQTNNQVSWKHTSPPGTSEYHSMVFGGYARDEFDPFGSDVTLSATAPPENPPAPGEIGEGRFGGIMDSRYSDIFDTNGCVVDDMPESCGVAAAMVNFGTGQSGGLLSTTFNMASFAQSLPLKFAPTTQLTTTLNVSGTEGRTTYETVWNDEYHEWVPQTPTAYSGIAPTEVSVMLASTSPLSLQQSRYTGPCPPTSDEIGRSAVLKEAVKEAQEEAFKERDTGKTPGWIEHGGWILWKKGTQDTFKYVIKPPQHAKNTPPGYQFTDTSIRVWLDAPPKAPAGWEIVATFHIHVNDVGPDRGDDIAADSRKTPGFVGQPDGKIFPVGNFKRGVFDRELPDRCR